MDAPRCRLCGEKHWSSDPHIWKAEIAQKAEQLPCKEKVVGSFPTFCPKDEKLEVAKAAFDKTAYQREYMRKRRAKKNA